MKKLGKFTLFMTLFISFQMVAMEEGGDKGKKKKPDGPVMSPRVLELVSQAGALERAESVDTLTHGLSPLARVHVLREVASEQEFNRRHRRSFSLPEDMLC